jgi:hypothetical protein
MVNWTILTQTFLWQIFQCFRSWFIDSGSGSGSSILSWIPIRIQGFDDQKLTKICSWKKFNIFLSTIAVYLSLGRHKGHPSHRRSLQPPKTNIQHFKTWNILFLWVIFALWIRIRIRWPDWVRIKSDPKHWKLYSFHTYTVAPCIRLFIAQWTTCAPISLSSSFIKALFLSFSVTYLSCILIVGLQKPATPKQGKY